MEDYFSLTESSQLHNVFSDHGNSGRRYQITFSPNRSFSRVERTYHVLLGSKPCAEAELRGDPGSPWNSFPPCILEKGSDESEHLSVFVIWRHSSQVRKTLVRCSIGVPCVFSMAFVEVLKYLDRLYWVPLKSSTEFFYHTVIQKSW